MSRQYFADVLCEPPLADQTAVTGTGETGLWNVASFSPIAANDCRPGKIYRLTAGGIMSFASTGSLTITPRFGTTTSGITMGASIAQTTPGATSGKPWFLEFTMICRTVGAPGANSTVIGSGLISLAATATAGTAVSIPFGGTSATVDVSIASGIFIGWTLTVAGTVTPQWAVMQSLN